MALNSQFFQMSRKSKMLGVERLSEASRVLSLGFASHVDSDGEENQIISGST